MKEQFRNAVVIAGILGTIVPARRWEHVVDYDNDEIINDGWEDFDTKLFQTWDNNYYELYPRLKNQLFFDDQVIIDEHRFMVPVQLRREDEIVYELDGNYGPKPLPRISNNKKKFMRRWRINTLVRKGQYHNYSHDTEKYVQDTLDDLPF